MSVANPLEFELTLDLNETDLKALNEHNGIQYKYFVAQKAHNNNDGSSFFLKQVEYNWRQVHLDKLSVSDSVELADRWPLVDVEHRRTRIDAGWLLDAREAEIQFHFFAQPLEIWSRSANGGGDVALTIVPLKQHSGTPGGLAPLTNYLVLTNVHSYLLLVLLYYYLPLYPATPCSCFLPTFLLHLPDAFDMNLSYLNILTKRTSTKIILSLIDALGLIHSTSPVSTHRIGSDFEKVLIV